MEYARVAIKSGVATAPNSADSSTAVVRRMCAETREQRSTRYAWRQALAIASFAISISIGLLYGLRELTTISSTFLLFYLASKVIEIPAENHISFGLKLMTGGGVFFGAWTWLQNNQALALKYLSV